MVDKDIFNNEGFTLGQALEHLVIGELGARKYEALTQDPEKPSSGAYLAYQRHMNIAPASRPDNWDCSSTVTKRGIAIIKQLSAVRGVNKARLIKLLSTGKWCGVGRMGGLLNPLVSIESRLWKDLNLNYSKSVAKFGKPDFSQVVDIKIFPGPAPIVEPILSQKKSIKQLLRDHFEEHPEDLQAYQSGFAQKKLLASQIAKQIGKVAISVERELRAAYN